MIEVLNTIEIATCENCHTEIKHLIGDLGTEDWYHVDSNRLWCPNAPLATPIVSTIKEV